MKYFILLILAPFLLSAQESNDPNAEKVINQLKATYNAFNDFSTDFALTIKIPEQDDLKHNGNLIEKNNKFNLLFDKSRIICDGNIIWNYIEEDNEIQINDYEEGENELLLTPKALIKKIENGEFIYALSENKKSNQTLEFKPVDRDEDFFKIKVNIVNGMVRHIGIYYKNGIRYNISLTNTKTNQGIEESIFYMDEKKYPGVTIEDMRL